VFNDLLNGSRAYGEQAARGQIVSQFSDLLGKTGFGGQLQNF
jgi:hypothetical protein